MRWRLVFPGILLGCLSLCLAGCYDNGHDSAHIPPPYTVDFEQRKVDDRLAFLTDCIRRKIDLAGSYYKRARIYLEKGEYEQALDDANRSIATRDNVGEYYLLRGIVNRELNRLDAARLDAERAEALQQKSPALYVLMADILQENKKYNESARYIKGVLALAPYDASVYYVQGMLQMKTGDTLAGLNSVEKALDLNPRFYRAYQPASNLYIRRGDYENGRRILLNGLKNFPSSPELMLGLARLYADHSQPDSSLLFYAQAIRTNKDDLDIPAEMATVYIKSRNYGAALGIYEDIQRKKQDYPSIHYLIGFCQEKLWRLNTARSYYEKELEITPGYVPARNGLWRISQLENERLRDEYNNASPAETGKTLDDSRLNITPILPRSIQN